jgi:flavin reductase (DIM6/NTAB) family NADH-FMN oxidoreductase RutF
MTIHTDHPFATPDEPVRRFRGRLGGAVSLWTAGSGTDRAGLTVSSLMVANGSPGSVVGLLDPDSALYEVLQDTGRAVVHLLEWADRGLADAFGGQAPAPGGAFALAGWSESDHGPVLPDRTRALVSLTDNREVGWSVLVTAAVDEVVMVDDAHALEHRRGRYHSR